MIVTSASGLMLFAKKRNGFGCFRRSGEDSPLVGLEDIQ
jgi:hypothetical protein